MGIIFGISFAFGSGGAALTSFGIGAIIYGSHVFLSQKNGNLHVHLEKGFSPPKKRNSMPKPIFPKKYPYKEDRQSRLNKGEFFFPQDHFNRIDKRYK